MKSKIIRTEIICGDLLQLGGFFIWTHTFQLVKSSAEKFKTLQFTEDETAKEPNKDLEGNGTTHLLNEEVQEYDARKPPVIHLLTFY